jgi:hypothetical protein
MSKLLNETFQRHLKLLKEKLQLDEKSFIDNHVAIAILGSPASGKTFMVDKLKKLARSNFIDKLDTVLTQGIDLTVDKLRAEFQSKNKKEQLRGFFDTFIWLRNQSTKEPDVYSKWFNDIKKTWVKIDGESDKITTQVDSNNKLTVNGKVSSADIYDILNNLPDDEVEKIINFLDSYSDFKRVVRWLQDAKQIEAKKEKRDLIFDEAGDEPEKIISKFKGLRSGNDEYITAIFLLHGPSPVTNLIQNAGRMVSGTDEGRDSSSAITQAWNDIQKGIGIYKSSSEQSITINNDDQEIVSLFNKLKSSNTDDNINTSNKSIDLFVNILTQSPQDAYARTNSKFQGLAKELFNAILLYHSINLNLDSNSKDIIRNLVPSNITENNINDIFKKAIESGQLNHRLNNLTKMYIPSQVTEQHDNNIKIGNLYCDMDGVVADFIGFVKKYVPNFEEEWDQLPVHTFKMLPKSPNADEIVSFLSNNFPDFIFLTASPKKHRGEIAEFSINDKNEWIEENFGISKNRVIVLHDKLEKSKYAVESDGTKNILIDDTKDNIDRWIQAGGIGILFENVNQMIKNLEPYINNASKHNKMNETFQRHLTLLHKKLKLNESVDINQTASTLQFKPVTKQKLVYKYVENGKPGSMSPMTYTKSTVQQPVVTTTTDGKETQNTAEVGDIIMSGATGENYVVKAAKLPKLYTGNVGSDIYPEQSPRQVALYSGEPVTFKAPWGEDMVIKPGDYLVKDPANTGYYRIAKVEFEKTYNKL